MATTQSVLSSAPAATDKSTFLRRVLVGNVVFSTVSAAAFIFGMNPLANLMGVPQPLVLLALGVALLPFALGVYLTAAQQPLDPRKALVILAADVLWVLGSVLILALDLFGLTTEGRWIVLILADIVLGFAVLEFFGLRRLR